MLCEATCGASPCGGRPGNTDPGDTRTCAGYCGAYHCGVGVVLGVEKGDEDVEQRIQSTWHANTFDVGHSAIEFKLDCGQAPPEAEEMTLYLRITANPLTAQQLFRLLGRELIRYADSFGPI